MTLLGYTLHLDALLARLIYRWRGRALLALLALLLLCGLVSGRIPPVWNGRADLRVSAAAGATVRIDGRSWPRPVYAGSHTIVAALPDGRVSWLELTIHANQALTITLPTGLTTPRERTLPPAAPGAHIAQVWWADNAWRVLSMPNPPPENTRGALTPTPAPGQTVAVSRSNVERLATLDAYMGLADQVHVHHQLREAVYISERNAAFGADRLGAIDVRGWDAAAQTIPISEPLALIRFAPDGGALLEAEQLASGGVQVYYLRPGQPRAPLVAVPGRIARLAWRDDSRAAVITSIAGERLTLTLVRLQPTLIAAAIADLPADRYAGAIVPMTWDDHGLLWVAPDQDGAATLWHAPLTSLIPDRRGSLPARAITRLPDGALRIVAIQGERIVIGRSVGDLFIGETTIPHVTPAADLSGIWQGDELLLQSGAQAWLLDIANETARP